MVAHNDKVQDQMERIQRFTREQNAHTQEVLKLGRHQGFNIFNHVAVEYYQQCYMQTQDFAQKKHLFGDFYEIFKIEQMLSNQELECIKSLGAYFFAQSREQKHDLSRAVQSVTSVLSYPSFKSKMGMLCASFKKQNVPPKLFAVLCVEVLNQRAMALDPIIKQSVQKGAAPKSVIEDQRKIGKYLLEQGSGAVPFMQKAILGRLLYTMGSFIGRQKVEPLSLCTDLLDYAVTQLNYPIWHALDESRAVGLRGSLWESWFKTNHAFLYGRFSDQERELIRAAQILLSKSDLLQKVIVYQKEGEVSPLAEASRGNLLELLVTHSPAQHVAPLLWGSAKIKENLMEALQSDPILVPYVQSVAQIAQGGVKSFLEQALLEVQVGAAPPKRRARI